MQFKKSVGEVPSESVSELFLNLWIVSKTHVGDCLVGELFFTMGLVDDPRSQTD